MTLREDHQARKTYPELHHTGRETIFDIILATRPQERSQQCKVAM